MPDLLGRSAELAAIDRLLAAPGVGRSGVIVVRGQAGIGKSALLSQAREAATRLGFRVIGCAGVEAETQFAFAGLHQLCAPLLDRVTNLPDPQCEALRVAFGSHPGPAPDRFLVGLAVLTLLADAADDRPLLCIVDDAQWLDSASGQVLAFVARRLEAEGVSMAIASRDLPPADTDPFAGMPTEIRLRGIGDDDARALLHGGVQVPLDDEIRNRIIAESRGNPLALLELPRSAQLTELAGGFELPDARAVPRRIEESFERRSRGLSDESQSLLLLAAADPTGDATLLWRAATELGLPYDTIAPAEASGLIEVSARVRFHHPLVRSAIYRSAAPGERRRVHGALAAATDPVREPDRRAWHRAQAVAGTDEDAAAELERTAERTRARGGVAAAAAFLQYATELTPDPADRAQRALDAAHAKHDAGASEAAEGLLALAEIGPLDDLQRARVTLLRARIAFHLRQGPEVPRRFLDAAETLAPIDPALSRETYLHALDSALYIGGDQGRVVLDAATAALAAPAAPPSPRPGDLLLDGLITTFTQGYAAGASEMRDALEAFRSHGFDGEALGEMGSRRWLALASRAGVARYDDELARVLAERNVQLAREAGALATLPQALIALSAILVLSGDIAHAAELAAESATITVETGARPLRFAELFVAAWSGREAETALLFTAVVEDTNQDGAEATLASYAMAVLHNGSGKYRAARDAALRAWRSLELTNSSLALPELVEAAVRADDRGNAEAALRELGERTRASGTPWALGLEARSRALTGDGPVADGYFREAIERLRESHMLGYLARTHLVYGEWLRRQGRRQDAREQLGTAHELLENMGAAAFAARAARELRATGEHPRSRSARTIPALSAQELQIARLVATGATSREVGAQLFLSPRTIEAHLRSIFRKLGLTSRRQLKDLDLP